MTSDKGGGGGVGELNKVALARLRLVQEYVSLMVEMEARLLAARIGAARARTLVGHTYASLTAADDVEEMRAVVRVEVSPSNEFSRVKEDDEEEGKEDKKNGEVRKRNKGGEEKGDAKVEQKEKEKSEKKDDGEEEEEEKPKKKSVPPPAFRPYGILEPGCAKEARKEAAQAAELAIAAATVRAKIIDCDAATSRLLEAMRGTDELQAIFALLAL